MNDTTDNFKTELFTALGEASMCWSETPKGVFESTRATEIGNRILDIHKRIVEEKDIKIKNLQRDLKASQSTAEQLAKHIEYKSSEIERLMKALKNLVGAVAKMQSLANEDEASEEDFLMVDEQIADAMDNADELLKLKTEKE